MSVLDAVINQIPTRSVEPRFASRGQYDHVRVLGQIAQREGVSGLYGGVTGLYDLLGAGEVFADEDVDVRLVVLSLCVWHFSLLLVNGR
jgi:hypothetical protein